MIRVIVTDIEGTTSSIDFVHEVLFPYAARNMADFVRTHSGEAAVKSALSAVAAEAELEPSDLDGQIRALLGWIREDRKTTSLKVLQGMIWEAGYRHGDFRGHIYPDAAEGLRRWHDRGLRLYVYSSGSEKAQKLLFGFSEAGDLTPLFSGYFDTRIGNKKQPESYLAILDSLGLTGSEVLFLSDVEAELTAAEAAGMQTCWLVRDGERPAGSRPVARNFDEVEQRLLASG